MLELLLSGESRRVLVVDRPAFDRWTTQLQRPPRELLRGVLQFVADRPYADLLKCSYIWKQLKGMPGVYEIRKDQARLYCCMHGGDIVIVAWEQKKRRQPDASVLAKARRLANEINED